MDRVVATIGKMRNNEVFRNETSNPIISLLRAK